MIPCEGIEGMGGLTRGCKDVRHHASAYEGVQGHVHLGEDVGGCMRAYKAMRVYGALQEPVRMCKSMRVHERTCEGVQSCARTCNGV